MRQIVETTKMSTKGQVIIPKETREFTNSQDDTIFAVFPVDKSTIVLKKLDKQKIVNEFRSLRKQVKDKVSEADVDAIIHKAR